MSTDSPLRFFTAKDADPAALRGQRVAVLGYGHLGRSSSLNLRDSGVDVVVGNIADSYADQARGDGFVVAPIAKAVAQADVVYILLPDELIPSVYDADVAPNLKKGAAIVFASGYALAYDLIQPCKDVDIIMVAPRMAGDKCRNRFLTGEGFFAFLSVERDVSGKAMARMLAVSNGIGVLQFGALELSAKNEANLDLFVEQNVGAALGMAIMQAIAIGSEAGIPVEALVMETYISGEMEGVFRAFREEGFFRASHAHGSTALFGGMRGVMDLMQSDVAERFQKTLADISDGGFARAFEEERTAGYPTLATANGMIEQDSPHVRAESRLRKLLGLEE